jgi:ketosteroid isomerase-like protein
MTPLPAPVAAYLDAANRLDSAAVAQCFTADAVVGDEGERYHGPEAIAAWASATIARYRPHAEPRALDGADGRYRLTALVAGDFPGSPVILAYRFTLNGERIAALEIAP